MDADFNSQDPDSSKHSPVVTTFLELVQFWTGGPFEKIMPTYLLRLYRRKKVANRLTSEIQDIIRAKFVEGSEKPLSTAARSVVALSMQNTETLNQEILDETSDQIKTFLFAGHDTTTILVQWATYQLSLNPKALATLRAELDAVLGPVSPTNDTTTAILEKGEAAIQKMVYTTAVIKETLRLFPPAAGARWSYEGEGLMLKLRDGREIDPSGMVMYINHYAIMRDKNVFGEDADEWKPERWIGNTETGAADDEGKTGGGVPASAWRPFERGPRNCIGQELAMLEARVILACLARRYVFEKVGQGAVVNGKIEEPLKNVSTERVGIDHGANNEQKIQITSRPADNMRVKVRMLDQSV
jgi:cytochrome P450